MKGYSVPCQDDPYTKLSPEEQELEFQRQIDEAERGPQKSDPEAPVAEPVEEEPSSVYVPATTWDGLETVGGFDDADWDSRHPFNGYVAWLCL